MTTGPEGRVRCYEHTPESLQGNADSSSVRIMTAYDDQNACAKILRGEIPCYRVDENSHTLALLDIMPRPPGHALVIPKAAAGGILDVHCQSHGGPADVA